MANPTLLEIQQTIQDTQQTMLSKMQFKKNLYKTVEKVKKGVPQNVPEGYTVDEEMAYVLLQIRSITTQEELDQFVIEYPYLSYYS